MISYFIKLILCSLLFLLTYKALFETERMHRFKRFYLITSLLLSFFIPLITIHLYTPALIANTSLLDSGNPFGYEQISSVPNQSIRTSLFEWAIALIYGLIASILLFRFCINLSIIFKKTKSIETATYKNAKVILTNDSVTPHSFLNYLFISKQDYNSGDIQKEILLHEYAHINQKHSYDIILIEMLHCFFWFNPTLFFYKKAMQLNHEFLADEAVVNASNNIIDYQYVLIGRASQKSAVYFTSQFNYSITKKRLMMMNKVKSAVIVWAKQISVAPLMALAIYLFSNPTNAQEVARIVPSTKFTTPSTKEGVSQDLLHEYQQIIASIKNGKGKISLKKLSDDNKKRLEEIFLLMSKEQQKNQPIVFFPIPKPFEKAVPTNVQIESWKNAGKYGVWIDEKRVSNSILNEYTNTDFAHFFVSKLEKNARNYGKHYVQVNLMTKEGYEKYYKEAISRKEKYYMGIVVEKRESK